MSSIIMWCLGHLNYWTIILFMTIESSFIPFPSEVVVPPAAWLAANGENGLNVVGVIIAATIGADLGALINYFLAKGLGRPVVYAFARSRFGHLCLINEEKVRRKILRRPWSNLHLLRQAYSGCTPTDFHTRRPCPHEAPQIPAVYHIRCRFMEHNSCYHRILVIQSARNTDTGADC